MSTPDVDDSREAALAASYARRLASLSRTCAVALLLAVACSGAILLDLCHAVDRLAPPGVSLGMRWIAASVMTALGALVLSAWRGRPGLAAEVIFRIDCAVVVVLGGLGASLAYLASFPRVRAWNEAWLDGGALAFSMVALRVGVWAWTHRLQRDSEREAQDLIDGVAEDRVRA